MKTRLITFLAFAIASSANSLLAQGGGPSRGQTMLLQGKELPDVAAYDEEGEPFALREKLNGKHAVLVFGCLT